ncbi:L-fuculose phosphate aldolase, partial [Dysosmobacter welbionis]
QVLRRRERAPALAAQGVLSGQQCFPHRGGQLDGQKETHEFFLLFTGFSLRFCLLRWYNRDHRQQTKGVPMRLQSAIFDMDGTLLDSMPIWRDLGTSVLRGLGIEPEPETDEMLKTLSLRHGIAYCKEHYHLPQTEEELIGRVVDRVADFYQHEVQAKPGVDKFLSLLKMEGVWMYVATATDRPLAEAALRHAGIDHYFRGLITVAEVGVGKKESAEIYERAM